MASSGERAITVQEQHTVMAQPDCATLTLVISSVKTTLPNARESVNKRVLWALQTLVQKGASKKTTTQFTDIEQVDAETVVLRTTIKSIFADRVQAVETHKFLVDKNPDKVQFLPLSFSCSQITVNAAAKDAATLAIGAAKAKAESMCTVVEASLGPILSVVEDKPSFDKDTFTGVIAVTCSVRCTFALA
eukprot:m.361438 g.361438  ORF g.361438 m.361438 type:complete len:190 (+) comp19589_c0_seq1:125-694(+)